MAWERDGGMRALDWCPGGEVHQHGPHARWLAGVRAVAGTQPAPPAAVFAATKVITVCVACVLVYARFHHRFLVRWGGNLPAADGACASPVLAVPRSPTSRCRAATPVVTTHMSLLHRVLGALQSAATVRPPVL